MTTAAISFLSVVVTPNQLSVSQRSSSGQALCFTKSSTLLKRISLSSLCSCTSSSSPSNPVIIEQESPSPPPESTTPDALPPTGGCEACGREKLESGCNGEGRIQGGIATVPGFGWWPIKAYRPCPGFVASGGRYRRRGQSMDEVVSGSGGRKEVSMATSDEAKSSKKNQGPRQFKK
ncbi:uncharacterized protein LOC131317928 [Rhododendron vialii]|uniref:uncharacterized protein LOC131317928 n=1 Tax=Rhododendron vialii TaxID=182163 RepID=UPI00265F7D86|nr:uncharacterized protein LOC131317928 [Rhododendron vialii]